MLSDISLPNMMIQSKTSNHLSIINNHLAMATVLCLEPCILCLESCILGLESSTSVEEPLQISSFLTNKANLLNTQMNVNKVITTDYENIANWTLGENKPNTNPIKPNLTQFPRPTRRNKPNTNPNKANFRGKKMLMRLTINGRSLLWIPAFAGMTAGRDERWILVDCRCGIVDN